MARKSSRSTTQGRTAAGLLPAKRPKGAAPAAVTRAELERLRLRLAELERNEAHFRELVERSPQPVLVHDERPLYANAAAVQLFGYDCLEDLLALPAYDLLYAPEFREVARTRRRERLQGTRLDPAVELPALRRDGTRLALMVHTRRIEWQGAQAVHCAYTDLSEHRRIAAERDADRTLLRTVLDALPHWVAVRDREGRNVLANRALLKDLGVSEADLSGTRPAQIGPADPAERALVERTDREVLAQGREVAIEDHPYTLPDGRSQRRHFIKVPLRDAAGAVQGLVSVSMDVTPQWEARRDAEASRRLLQNVVDSIPHLVFVKDLASRYVLVNRTKLDFYGVEAEAVVGRPFLDVPIATREERAGMLAHDQQVLHQGQQMHQPHLRVTRLDGSVRILRQVKVPLRDEAGAIIGLVGVAEDVTAEQRAEGELRAQRRLLQTVFDAIPTWLFVKDRESRFVMVNEMLARDVGLAAEGFRGLDHFSAPQGTAEERAALRTDEQRLIAGGGPIEQEERLTLPGGRSTWRYVRKVPLRNDAGEIIGLVGISEDITARREMEDQIRRMQRMESIGTLAGGIAHDFNNILFPILGYTELTLLDLAPDSAAHRNLTTVRDAALRAKDIVAQILAFSRQGDNRPEVLQLRPLIGESLRFLASTLPSTVRIEAELAPDVAPVFADAVQMHQVLMNLCVNAAHAMPDGGQLRVTLQNVELVGYKGFAGGLLSGRCVRLAVEDSGMGMDATTLAHIFEPFFTTKPVGQGTGLGLSTVLGIVTQHKGVVNVITAPAEGATFEVYLPAVQETPALVPPPAPSRQQPAARPLAATILYVDDEPAIAELAREVLERQGYRVMSHTSSRAALEAFTREPLAYDLLITDQTMPDLTGERLAAEVRRVRPDLPIVIGTGNGQALTPEVIERLGIAEVFVKPVSGDELGRVVERALRTRP